MFPIKSFLKNNLPFLTFDFRLFLFRQSTAGMILVMSALLAIVIANSSYSDLYYKLLSIPLPLNFPDFGIYKEMNLRLWIDDGLMAIFFLLVTLEIKREILIGELSKREKMALPFFAACGGVILPMLIFYLINHSEPQNFPGIAIPSATDIAFSIGILSLFGNRISYSLKIFLVALAIIDDLIAILIIAFFYSSNLDLTYLNYAMMAILVLFILNSFKISSLIPYLTIAPFLWIFFLKSGIHSTIAGVTLALFIPFNKNEKFSPAKFLERILHFPVTYFILPIFAFVNSGLILRDFSAAILLDKLVLGIMLGLFLGKQLGIGLVVYLCDKFKICPFFKDVSFLEFYGVAVIAGIGFTMSLFIGNLAFTDAYMIDKVRIGVILGSILSAILGFIILRISIIKKVTKNG